MRSSLLVGVLVVVGLSACGDKACPQCPAPGTGTGTGTGTGGAPIDAAASDDDGYEFRLVEKDGKAAFVGTSIKGRVLVIPVDPRSRAYADAKQGTADELMTFTVAENGGCPCRLPQCWPYCRVAAPVLDLAPQDFWGSADVPKWTQPAPAPAPTP